MLAAAIKKVPGIQNGVTFKSGISENRIQNYGCPVFFSNGIAGDARSSDTGDIGPVAVAKPWIGGEDIRIPAVVDIAANAPGVVSFSFHEPGQFASHMHGPLHFPDLVNIMGNPTLFGQVIINRLSFEWNGVTDNGLGTFKDMSRIK
ncbi:MAG: hypothetical protein ABSH41_05820 [Syntrophobacteraceae bacterium]